MTQILFGVSIGVACGLTVSGSGSNGRFCSISCKQNTAIMHSCLVFMGISSPAGTVTMIASCRSYKEYLWELCRFRLSVRQKLHFRDQNGLFSDMWEGETEKIDCGGHSTTPVGHRFLPCQCSHSMSCHLHLLQAVRLL